MHLFALLLLMLVFLSAESSEQEIPPLVKNSLLFSYDDIEVVEHEKMGLVGGSYLYPLGFGVKTGLGIYGAVKGDRGGFFTGGLSITWDKTLFRNYFFATQVFAGGGGGGAAPQGGGLMHRVSGELGFSVSAHRFAAGLSYVNFPNGEIESQQFTFSYSRYIENLHLSGVRPSTPVLASWASALNQRFLSSPQNFSLQYLSYYPDDDHQGRSGKTLNERMDVVGIRWSHQMQNRFWFEFETAGAVGGGIDGFAQVLGGLSYRFTLLDWLTLNSGSLLGAAGGGMWILVEEHLFVLLPVLTLQ